VRCDGEVSAGGEELDRGEDGVGAVVALVEGEGLLPPRLGFAQRGDASFDGFGEKVIGEGVTDLGVDGVSVDEALLPCRSFRLVAEQEGETFGFAGADAAGAAEHLLHGGDRNGVEADAGVPDDHGASWKVHARGDSGRGDEDVDLTLPELAFGVVLVWPVFVVQADAD
jgi:hypothetical protein